MEKPVSYISLLEMDPVPFMDYLERFNQDISFDVGDPGSLKHAVSFLQKIPSVYAFLSSLCSYAGIRKRELQRAGETSKYRDMVDKEACIDRMMRAVDMRYKALSKAITVYLDSTKELYMTGGKIHQK